MAKICDRCDPKTESVGTLYCSFASTADKEIVDLCENCREDFFRNLERFLKPPKALGTGHEPSVET